MAEIVDKFLRKIPIGKFYHSIASSKQATYSYYNKSVKKYITANRILLLLTKYPIINYINSYNSIFFDCFKKTDASFVTLHLDKLIEPLTKNSQWDKLPRMPKLDKCKFCRIRNTTCKICLGTNFVFLNSKYTNAQKIKNNYFLINIVRFLYQNQTKIHLKENSKLTTNHLYFKNKNVLGIAMPCIPDDLSEV